MGIIADTLGAPSAYRVKKDNPNLWADLTDRINGALLPAQLDEIEAEFEARPLDMPFGWYLEAQDLIDQKREALREEDIGLILRDRFDF
jgi:hypothetical protein